MYKSNKRKYPPYVNKPFKKPSARYYDNNNVRSNTEVTTTYQGLVDKKAILNNTYSGMLGVELKNKDQPYNAGGSSSLETCEALLLNGIAQGSGADQRDGRQIRLRKGLARAMFKNFNGYDEVYRIVIVMDTQANGTELTGTQLGDLLFEDFNENSRYFCYQKLANQKRFRVIKDEREVMSGNQTTVIDSNNTTANFFIPNWGRSNMSYKLDDMEVNYKDANGTITSITDVALYALLIFPPNILLEFTSRVRYVG